MLRCGQVCLLRESNDYVSSSFRIETRFVSAAGLRTWTLGDLVDLFCFCVRYCLQSHLVSSFGLPRIFWHLFWHTIGRRCRTRSLGFFVLDVDGPIVKGPAWSTACGIIVEDGCCHFGFFLYGRLSLVLGACFNCFTSTSALAFSSTWPKYFLIR